MTPSSSQKISQRLNLGRLKGKEIIANFSGGKITSDAGIVLMAELDKKLKITSRFADCFQDYRNLSKIDYSVHQLVAQRIYGLILGYEDVNDHDKFRYDPALAIALEKLDFIESNQGHLAGKSTINRLEYCPETILKQEESRYHLEKAKNEYYRKIEPVVELMDSIFSKDEDLEEVKKLVPSSTWYRSLCYQTEKSWSRQKRVVTKVCYGSGGLKMRHVVTSLPASKIPPSKLYTDKYCPRGEMENRIKEQQLDLFADRTSTQTFQSNQLRLWFSSFSYVLMQAFRHHCLAKTSFAKATVGTIRLNFLKLGARITVSVRRILIAISSSCPYQDILGIAHFRIQAIQDTC